MAQYVEVVLTTSGQPLRIRRDGRVWNVAATPVRWHERIPWWRTEWRMPRESGLKIDVTVWQVQVRLGDNLDTELVTWHLIYEDNLARWSIREDSPQGDGHAPG